MIPVLRKVAQLNIQTEKNGGPIIDICTGAQPDKVTALARTKQLNVPSSFLFNIKFLYFVQYF